MVQQFIKRRQKEHLAAQQKRQLSLQQAKEATAARLERLRVYCIKQALHVCILTLNTCTLRLYS